MLDKKSVVGQNNNELWHHLCPDEEKVWCAFPPSLSHMFFFHFPFPSKKKYQQNVDSWNERGKGKLMVSFFSKKKIMMDKNQLFDFFKPKNWTTNKRTNPQRIRLQRLSREYLYFLIYSWFFFVSKIHLFFPSLNQIFQYILYIIYSF